MAIGNSPGHAFWSADGKTMVMICESTRGEDLWVGPAHVANGARTQYDLQRNEWSVHFNVSPDGNHFPATAATGMVADAPDGKWLYLFTPELVPDETGTNVAEKNLIKPGVFHSKNSST